MSKIALCDIRGPLTDLIEKLSGENGDEWLEFLKQMLRKDRIIDCDADPFIPFHDWEVVEHIRGGQFKWGPTKVTLYLAKGQKAGKVIEGHELRKELKRQPVLNANVLDFLLKNLHLIPESWKGKLVFFWGTIYRDSVGCLQVRCLVWSGIKWYWKYERLGLTWEGHYPAAVRASR